MEGETTKELVARLRRQHAESVNQMLTWGFSEQMLREQREDDARYMRARWAEQDAIDQKVEDELKEERIFERLRARDRAYGG